MYKISVPLTLNGVVARNDYEAIYAELKRFGAERVFLSSGSYTLSESEFEERFKDLKKATAFFKSKGLEVGYWNWSFMFSNEHPYACLTDFNGKKIDAFACPSDENFVKFSADYFKRFADCGIDILLFDDDLRFGFYSEFPTCLCDNHIAKINEILDENLTREELKEKILNGAKNKYRDAYIKSNGEFLKNFCRNMRETIDTVNPKLRIGYCACMTNWDLDGVTASELSHILAGNSTKPILRLIGAPYWAVEKNDNNNLQDVIELERMERSWIGDDDIEIIAEGDAYPRPRFRCPASYLEGFDTAIRVSGCTDGILKYGIDYHSDINYENGYRKFHERNIENYKLIEKYFSDKKSTGIRIYESAKKISDAVVPTKINETTNFEHLFFSNAARTLAHNTIPTVYEGRGVCGICFDENARNLPFEALENGLIIDIAAAEILTECGIDVGIKEFICNEKGLCNIIPASEEYFIKENNFVDSNGIKIYDIVIDEKAEVLSCLKVDQTIFICNTDQGYENKEIPMSYRYENASGQRFLVLNMNTRHFESAWQTNVLKQYARSRQIADAVEWLSGKKLPAYSYGNPAMYIQTKESDGALAVGIWNFFADIAIEPVVELAYTYKSIEFINCSGELKGDRVYLSDIPAFGFVGFEVKK